MSLGRRWCRPVVITAFASMAVLLPLCSQEVAKLNTSNPRVHIPVRSLPPKADGSHAPLRVDVHLVLIPVTVTNPLGSPVSGLQRDDFKLLEDGTPQTIEYFAVQDTPASIGIVLDTSGSMEGAKLERAKAAIGELMAARMPEDEYFLVTFNQAPTLVSDFAREAGRIESDLQTVSAEGWTALRDAVYLAISAMKNASNARKALVILSDGDDNRSRYSEGELRSLIREADVCIYSIGLLGSGFSRRGQRLLQDMSEETGGVTVQAANAHELPDAIQKLSEHLRSQYLLGYSPNRPSDGRYRKVEVQVTKREDFPPLRAAWRSGYYSPLP